MGELYIYLLLCVIPTVAMMIIAARIVLQFSLANHLNTIKDRLNSMAMKSPEITREREFAFAKMQNDSHVAIAILGMNEAVAKSLFLNIDAADGKNRKRHEKKEIDMQDIKNRNIRRMLFASTASFLGLLAANSATDLWFVLSTFMVIVYRQVFSMKNTSILNEMRRRLFSMDRYRGFDDAAFAT